MSVSRPTRFAVPLSWLIVMFVLSFGASVHAQSIEQSYWGKKLPSQPRDFVFGYGSLINSESRSATEGRHTVGIPVRISADLGLVREWNFQSPTAKLTALGLRKVTDGERGSTINGVIFPVEGTSIEKYDEREQGYQRMEIPRSRIEAVSWLGLPPVGTKIWVYVPNGPLGPGKGLRPATREYPIVQTYIDITVLGALEYGEGFARELLATTYGWNDFWLNDRLLGRRPWVYQSEYKAIDALLNEKDIPIQPYFKKRKLPVEYATLPR